jgi:nucleoside-diphosphate-sugar epimerase
MILVTGGFGYLGGRICKSLINSGNKVRIGTSRKNVSIPKELSKCDIWNTNIFSARPYSDFVT